MEEQQQKNMKGRSSTASDVYNRETVTMLGNDNEYNTSAPSITNNEPKFDLPNASINKEQKKAITI